MLVKTSLSCWNASLPAGVQDKDLGLPFLVETEAPQRCSTATGTKKEKWIAKLHLYLVECTVINAGSQASVLFNHKEETLI